MRALIAIVIAIVIAIAISLNAFAGAQEMNPSPACANPLSADINNSCIVTPDVLWRGASPDAIAAAALVELGVQTVVNLQLLHDDKSAFANARIAAGVQREVNYFRVPDWEPLAAIYTKKVDDHVAHFLAIMQTQPKPVYVHCRAGRNRTGVMVAAYRVFSGMRHEDAIAEMQRFDGAWFKFDAAYIRSLTPQRKHEIEKKIAAWIPKLKTDAVFVCANGRCEVVAR